jgi:hypothetical protein
MDTFIITYLNGKNIKRQKEVEAHSAQQAERQFKDDHELDGFKVLSVTKKLIRFSDVDRHFNEVSPRTGFNRRFY